jgi:molecular chaperone DnaK (HSP70)
MYKNQLRVGILALDVMHLAPHDTITSVKRLMGRAFKDEQVQKVRQRCQYEVAEPADGTDEDIRVVMSGKPYSPVEISAEVLKKIKKDAESRLNDTVEYAVITVPAYFNEKQREATRRAAQLAGLKVQRILAEPTAAAIAFGVENMGQDDAKTILVYDFGGGTFDVSVLTIVGGVFAELDIEGDMWLGGNDFDQLIMDRVVDHVKAMYDVDPRKDPRFMAMLMKAAEKAKKNLSDMIRTDIRVEGVLKDEEGNLIDIEMELSRAEFEGMIKGRVEDSLKLVNKAIRNAGELMTAEQIDHVILVGGSSCIPLVRDSLKKVFGKDASGRDKVLANVDPMRCVAYGAALLSARILGQVECPRGHVNPDTAKVCQVEQCRMPIVPPIEWGPTTPIPYGIQVEGDRFEIVIPKGTPCPTPEPVTETFRTPSPNMRRLRVPVYAGFDSVASKNELQATVWLELPDKVPVDTQLEVAFSMDGDGILASVRVALLDGSGTQVETFLDRGNSKRSLQERRLEEVKRQRAAMKDALEGDAASEFENMYGQAAQSLNRNDGEGAQKIIDRIEERLKNVAPAPLDPWKVRAQNISNYAEVVLDNYGWLLDPPTTTLLKRLVSDVRQALAAEDEERTKQKTDELDKATNVQDPTDSESEGKLPATVGLCMMLMRAQNIARERAMEIEAQRAQNLYREVESALRRDDFGAAFAAVQRNEDLLKLIFESRATDSKTDYGKDLVKK